MADRKTDLPILFSPPMVRGLLREVERPGTGKTNTRRVLDPQPPTREQFPHSDFGLCPAVADGVKMYSQNDYERLPKHPTDWELVGSVGVARDAGFPKKYRLRYAVGDRLWVREAWRTDPDRDDLKPSEVPPTAPLLHEADDPDRPKPLRFWGRYRHARYLPRWASRLTLLVTDVRVQRLQELGDEDARAEGIHQVGDLDGRTLWGYDEVGRVGVGCRTSVTVQPAGWERPRSAFANLWDRLHGPDAWASNPWVAAYTFTVHACNIDQLEEAA